MTTVWPQLLVLPGKRAENRNLELAEISRRMKLLAKRMTVGDQPEKTPQPPGRVPRISRLMALAIRFDELLQQGHVKDYADIARLGHVTRARATQIMSLLNLASDIQEAILFLPPTVAGRDAIKEWQVRPIAACAEWKRQRGMWRRLWTSI